MKSMRVYFLFFVCLSITIVVSFGLAGCATAKKACIEEQRTAEGISTNARETKNPTPLDLYVYKPDENYSYKLVKKDVIDDMSIFYIDMTSQRWRKPEEVDRVIWRHWVTIVVPNKVKGNTALLVISGGRNSNEPPISSAPLLRRFAKEVGTVVAEVKQIPNEPLVFSDDGKSRTEDGIIAYNWDKYLRTGDHEWLTRMPMTKAVVRAMDTVQEFCASKDGGGVKVSNFVLAGASKRGWTTWTATIVDKRVIACVPMVIDLLNLVPSFKHHYEVYGDWAPAINDYVEMKIMDWLVTPEFASMLNIVDPYSYRDRLTMPKYIVNSAGDEFFLPDSWKFYLADLKGPTYIRYVPNTGHALKPEVVDGIVAFYKAVVNKKPIPYINWSFPDDTTIIVKPSEKPLEVVLWEGVNPDARDFRHNVVGDIYKPSLLAAQKDGSYVAKVSIPEKGWKAYLVEVVFRGPENTRFTFSTPVRIVPDTVQYKYAPPAELPKGFLSK